MTIKEGKSATVEIPESSSHSDPTNALEPVLLQELEELESQEQQVLCEFLKRVKRNRAVSGDIDELAVVVNGLKEYQVKGEWLDFRKINEKIAPDLHKEFIGTEKIQLKTTFPPMADSISEVLKNRTSIRDFKGTALPLEKLSALLNYSCGVRGTISAYNRRDITLRNFPTPGGLQCTEFYLVINSVKDISQGLYHYSSIQNCLELIEKGNFRWRITNCCPQHEWLAEANAIILVASDISRLAWKYGAYRSYRLAHLETGVASQNVHLVATALELGSCMVFGFDDERIDSLLGLDGLQEFTVLLIAIGDKKSLRQKSTVKK